MKIFIVYEDDLATGSDNQRTFRKLERALAYAKKSEYPKIVLHEYDGDRNDPIANYRNTHYTKGGN